jgi:hypothetical protein
VNSFCIHGGENDAQIALPGLTEPSHGISLAQCGVLRSSSLATEAVMHRVVECRLVGALPVRSIKGIRTAVALTCRVIAFSMKPGIPNFDFAREKQFGV